MRKLSTILITIVLLISLCGCTSQASLTEAQMSNSADQPVSIIFASDLHYISPQLTDNGAYFTQLITNADSKLMMYSETLVDVFVDTVLDEHPDVLVLCGDLSFNGEKLSLEGLAKKLEPIQENGTQILAIPGNHDINNPYARKYSGDTYEEADNTDANEFQSIFHLYGYDQAIAKDKSSGSYIYQVRSDLWVLMLDTNSYSDDHVTDKTFSWLEKQLSKAQQEGIEVLGISHQNLKAHDSIYKEGYVIHEYLALQELYAKYDVRLNLSGHMHVQHITFGDTTEILTSAFSVYPQRWASITYDGKDFDYQTQSLDVQGWAKKTNQSDENLLNFAQFSKDFFNSGDHNQLKETVSHFGLSEEKSQLMVDTYLKLNDAFFQGEVIDKEELSPGVELWYENLEQFEYFFIDHLWNDLAQQNNYQTYSTKK